MHPQRRLAHSRCSRILRYIPVLARHPKESGLKASECVLLLGGCWGRWTFLDIRMGEREANTTVRKSLSGEPLHRMLRTEPQG